jgi:anhydro-N-acetylmuramic acid kinase
VSDNLQIILKKYLDKPVQDLLNTYTIHSANQIAKNLENISSVLVTGGGAFNSFLISSIKDKTNCEIIIPGTDIVNFKEAIIFAFLSVLKLRGEVNCLSSVTGSKYDHSSGKIFLPNPSID